MRKIYHARYGNTWSIALCSGDGDEHPGCTLKLIGFVHFVTIPLPPIIKPHRRKVIAGSWDAATVERLGRNWYWDYTEREYGFSISDNNFFNVYLGRQSHDSSTEQRWSCFLPWTSWRHVRTSIYGLQGEHLLDMPQKFGDDYWKARDSAPTASFTFRDFDGEVIVAKCRIEEREWRLGERWFRWLSWFAKPKIRRSLDIAFSAEVGRRKGSWKGGTVGHGIEMEPGELHAEAFARYCVEHKLELIGAVTA